MRYGGLDAGFAIGGGDGFEAIKTQRVRDQFTNVGCVFDDENLLHHRFAPRGRWACADFIN